MFPDFDNEHFERIPPASQTTIVATAATSTEPSTSDGTGERAAVERLAVSIGESRAANYKSC